MLAIATACGYTTAHSTMNTDEIGRLVIDAVEGNRSCFLEVKVCSEARENLGRPHKIPVEAKGDFMSDFCAFNNQN